MIPAEHVRVLELPSLAVDGAMRELGELLEAEDPFDSLDSHTVAVYKQMANTLRS